MSNAARAKVLIADGHSLIFAWEDLRALHESAQETARGLLCRMLTHFQDATGEQVVVVFDGQGSKSTTTRESAQEIQVTYSDRGKTADDVIERLVAKYSQRYDITVVTGDRAEAETVMAFGALACGPVVFRERLDKVIE